MNSMSLLTPNRTVTCIAAAVVISTLAACGGSSGNNKDRETGIVSMAITDAPVDNVTLVQLSISRIDLKPARGNVVVYTPAEPIIIENLLDLQGTNAVALLPATEVPAGDYNWLRLYIDGGYPDSFVVTNEGGNVDLLVPGQQGSNLPNTRHIQLVSGFAVPVGGRADFTIDVDLRRALTKPANQDYYLLRPALRITDDSTTGSIFGVVDEALVMDEECTNNLGNDQGVAVYLYEGTGATTGDIHVNDNGGTIGNDNPLTTGNVRLDTQSGLLTYSIGFVPAGDYTAALTCQALDDMPDQNDEILFSQSLNIAVVAGQNTSADFTTSP
ncbi:MAG: DUF4382 domain-containing protein [Alcanivoracaceae bacterium]